MIKLFTSVEEVLDAYEKSELHPMMHGYMNAEEKCGCAITALIASKESKDKVLNLFCNDDDDDGVDLSELAILLGIGDEDDTSILEAFICGFDGVRNTYDPILEEVKFKHHELGRQVFQAVFDKYGKIYDDIYEEYIIKSPSTTIDE